MDIFIDILKLLGGFVLLIKGADFFVEGSSAVARKFKIPSIVVGLTIVAMGTSLPELAVSLSAALEGSNEIAISNVVGSNIFNLLIVLGVCAAISPITVDKTVMKRDMPFMLIITAALVVFFADFILPWTGIEKIVDFAGLLSRFDAVILLIVFVSYLVFTVMYALKNRTSTEDEEEIKGKTDNMLINILFIVGGVAAIKFGGDFVVEGASNIALFIGMSETLVGLTIVAVGTSLPELVTSVVAARKNETSLAIGNVVGSNIFNILFILGTSAVITPIPVIMDSLIDISIVLGISIIAFFFCKTNNKLGRKEGAAMISIYIAYMVYAIIR